MNLKVVGAVLATIAIALTVLCTVITLEIKEAVDNLDNKKIEEHINEEKSDWSN